MATEAQISANRQNAKLSTGPRSQAGSARSSMNALKSGIHAKSEVIPGEDPEQLAELTAEYYQSIQPQSREEAVLVDQLISADWQLRRLRHAEAGIFTKFMDKPSRTASGWAYMNNSASLDRCYRNQAAISRNLRASLDSLLRLRRNAGLLQVDQPLSPGDSEPQEPDETNPIPGGAEASAPPPSFCPAQADPESMPPELDETDPISEAPVSSPQPPVASPQKTDPQPLPPEPRFTPVPGIHYTYNLQTGQIEPLPRDRDKAA